MATLKAFYDPWPAEAVTLSTPAQVDELLDRMAAEAESPEVEVGLVAQIDGKDDDEGWSILQFGIRAAGSLCGFVGHVGKDSASVMSDNGGTSPEMIAYDYQYNEREVPSNAEVSLDTVRKAVHDYVASGGARPGGVTWREL